MTFPLRDAASTGEHEACTAAVSQEHLSVQLMNALRAEMLSEKYGYMTVSTLVGVLEMLKYEVLERDP